MKNNKGITMISLVITIIVLIIVTSITIYNGTAQLGIKRVNNLYADIDSISTKVAEYYLKNEKLPVFENEYIDSQTNLEKLFKENGATANITNINDKGGAYYVIDLTKLDNLTLNYGDDYKEWSNTSTSDDLQNIYIINSVTHQIYFPHGVRSGKDYYFAKFPDENGVSPVELEDIEDEWSVKINNISSNEVDENSISLLADVTLKGLIDNYNMDSLEYAWTDTNVESEIENVSFTKFNVNETSEEDKTATIASKALSNTAEYYYLWVKVVDINGKVNYQNIRNSASPLTGNLPSNYQKVEYIQSSGTQWIDTKVIPKVDLNGEFVIEALNRGYPFGSTNGQNEDYWGVNFYSKGQIECYFGTGSYPKVHSWESNRKYNIIIENKKFYCDNNMIYDFNNSTNTYNFNTTQSIYLFRNEL